MARQNWANRTTFILAAVGSAVGLGNAWRFPGLIAQHGGGAFLIAYLLAMLVMGIPLLMMEIAIGRRMRTGAPGCLRGMNRKLEPIGWASTTNAFFIVSYYAVVFAWVILMAVVSFRFAGMTGAPDAADQASGLFTEMIKMGDITDFDTISTPVFLALIAAWFLIYACIRNGAQSVSKVVKYTVFLPIICLLLLAVRGFTMDGAMEGIAKLFIPDVSAFADAGLWIDAIGQVFYSLSVMMAIMFAYGSYLDRSSNVAADVMIIAFSDMAVSILAGIVMFTTMYGCGMEGSFTPSGVSTAFFVYPVAIVNFTSLGWLNAVFGFLFYFCLCTLAIDSAFSIVEGISTGVADKFRLDHRKTTLTICLVAGVVSLVFITSAGLNWLDILDNWINQFNLIIIGICECIAVGWCFNTRKVLEEVNLNTKKFRVPAFWFLGTVRFVAPVLLTGFLGWNLYHLFVENKGNYGGYPMYALVVAGWAVTVLVLISGFLIRPLINYLKKYKGYVEPDQTWDSADLLGDRQEEELLH